MAEVAGRGRGRQAVLPAWMTRGVGSAAPTPTSGVGGGRGCVVPPSPTTADLKNKVSHSSNTTETKTVLPNTALTTLARATPSSSSSSAQEPGIAATFLASRQPASQKANQHLLKASSNKPEPELPSDNQNAQKDRRRRSPLPAASATRNHRTHVSTNQSHPKSAVRRSSRSRSDSPPPRNRCPPSSPKKRHRAPPPTAKKVGAPKHDSKRKAVDSFKKRKGGETSSSSSSPPPSRSRETATATTTSRGRQSRKQACSTSSSSRSASPKLPSSGPAVSSSSHIRGRHPPPKKRSSTSSTSSERRPKKIKKNRSSSPNNSKPSAASPGLSSSPSRRKKTDGPHQAPTTKRQTTTYRRRRSSSSLSPAPPPNRRSVSATRSNAAVGLLGQKRRRKSHSSSPDQDASPAASRRHPQRGTKQTVNGKGTGKPSKAHRRSISSQSSVESVSSDEVAHTTAAVLCDRLLSLRNIPWKQRGSRLKDFTSCFSNDTDFYAEDRDGSPLAFRKLQKRFFLDGPDKVEVTRRLFLEESDVHSFSLDYEYDEDLCQVVLYECRNGKIVRVYQFRDKDKHASPKRAVSLEDVKNSSVYRQVFKYACKKGLNGTKAVHHYYDYASEQ